MSNNFNDSVSDFVAKITDYFSSLSQLEFIGWILIGVGFVLVILGIIFM